MRDGFDFLDLEDPKVGEPPVESEQRIVVGADPRRWHIAGNGLVNSRHRVGPSMCSLPMPNPMMRRVNTSMTTRTQWLRRRIDSQRKRSTLQRLSLVCARKLSQEGPLGVGLLGTIVRCQDSAHDRPYQSRRRRHGRSAGRCADSQRKGYETSILRWP